MEDKKNYQCKELVEEVRRCMARVLDDCELMLGDQEKWKFFRSRVLKNFGPRGLEGAVIEIMTNSGPDKSLLESIHG